MVLQRDQICFAVLLLCVPIQYLAVNYMGSTETSRNYAISKMVDQVHELKQKWLQIEPWKRWCKSFILKLSEGSFSFPSDEDDMGESPAYEVLKFREKNGHFGQSTTIRAGKPPSVKFRVGQVVQHKDRKYRGVIIGWDKNAKAPKQWLNIHHKGKPEWTSQPNYSILVDTRDRQAAQMTYVPQENLVAIKNTKIIHPSIEDYFEHFDGSQYIARPWLKTLYPRD